MNCAPSFALSWIDGACFGAECLASVLKTVCLVFSRVASTSYGTESLASRFNTLHLAKPYLKELAHSILRGLLQRGASEPGEAKAAGKVLADFPHETMEGSLADQEVRRPLVLSDFAQRDGAYAEPVRPSDWAKAANGSTAASFSAVGHSLCVRAAAARPFMRSVLRCDCDLVQ